MELLEILKEWDDQVSEIVEGFDHDDEESIQKEILTVYSDILERQVEIEIVFVTKQYAWGGGEDHEEDGRYVDLVFTASIEKTGGYFSYSHAYDSWDGGETNLVAVEQVEEFGYYESE